MQNMEKKLLLFTQIFTFAISFFFIDNGEFSEILINLEQWHTNNISKNA